MQWMTELGIATTLLDDGSNYPPSTDDGNSKEGGYDSANRQREK